VRLGILGGTFDPPHVGHLLAASDAFEALALDRLLFIPAAAQPLKVGAVRATAEQRAAMLELLVAGDGRFAVDRMEIERGGLSYTVETLAALRRRDPGARLFFLIGEDIAAQLAKWREPARIAELAELVVLQRESPPAGEPAASPFPLTRLRTRRVDVSSTEIRERVRAGLTIHGFVPDTIAAYITAAGLYR
jgi:nicotinate-nucleotide adenylyltransferase